MSEEKSCWLFTCQHSPFPALPTQAHDKQPGAGLPNVATDKMSCLALALL